MTHFIIHVSASSHGILRFSNHMFCATKYAVTALTEGLRQELRSIKSRIRINTVIFDAKIAAYNDSCLL